MYNIRKNIKRVIAVVIAFIQLMVSNEYMITVNAIGNEADNKHQTTDNTVHGHTNDPNLRIRYDYQGQRFYIVNKYGNRVSSVLDITNTSPSVVLTGDGIFDVGKIYTNGYTTQLNSDTQ